jgi:DNA polymerase elongation subunit (family B)
MNIAFDLAASEILHELTEKWWKITTWSATSGTSFLKIQKDDRKIVFVDVANYMRASVRKLGEILGIEKLDVNPLTATLNELIPYCRRDVEIITYAMLKFFDYIRENNLGGLGLSISSTAFKAFRHRFMKYPIYIHDFDPALELERRSYYGGRVECFRIGHVNRKIYVLDVNSMYPFVMRYNYFPVKLVKYDETSTVDVVRDYLDRGYCVIAHVFVKTNEPVYPKKLKDKLIFPVGRFHTFLTTPSLKYAFYNNNIVRTYEYAVYVPQVIFDEYIEFFYTERLKFKREGNTVYDFMSKLFMNSLYGKFAQRRREIEECEEALTVPHLTRMYDENLNYIGRAVHINNNGFLVKKAQDYSFNSFPAISAHVTDYARMYLWHLMKTAGLKHVLYVDTDSLHVTAEGYRNLQNLIDAQGLGKLKLEDVTYSATYFAPKHYIVGNKVKQKGISQNAKQIDDNTYEQFEFPSLQSVVINNVEGVPIRKVIKRLRLEYEKGIVDENGHIHPIRLNEDPNTFEPVENLNADLDD